MFHKRFNILRFALIGFMVGLLAIVFLATRTQVVVAEEPPCTLAVSTPASHITVGPGEPVNISYSYWTTDNYPTFIFEATGPVTEEITMVSLSSGSGSDTLQWATEGVPPGTYTIQGYILDQSDVLVGCSDTAPGAVTIMPSCSIPNAPVLLQPPMQDIVFTYRPTFTWQAVDGADHYIIQIS